MNYTEKVGQVLFETSGNTWVVLELEEEVFDQMPVFIQALVICSGVFSIPSTGNHRNATLRADRIDEFLAVISFICKHITVLQIESGDQITGWRIITDLSARQINLDRVTQRVNYGMNLRGISTSRTTNPLLFSPPFSTRGMLVHPDIRSIDHIRFIILVFGQLQKRFFPRYRVLSTGNIGYTRCSRNQTVPVNLAKVLLF